MTDDKKNFLKYFAAPFAGILLVFYLIFGGVSYVLQKNPMPKPGTLARCVVSRVLDELDLNILFFALPEEFFSEAKEKLQGQNTIQARQYYWLLYDLSGAGIAYRFIPHAVAIALFVSILTLGFARNEDEAKPEAKRNDKHIRGARRVGAIEFCKRIKKAVLDPCVAVMSDGGALVFSSNRLREHMAVFGASGSGKSQLLLAFLASFFKNSSGARVVVIDRKGEFFANFGRDEDLIFNPFDERSIKWSLFNEIELDENGGDVPADVRAIANILFPEPKGGQDPFWNHAAADVFCSAACACIRAGKTSNADLVDFCNQAPKDIISAFKDLPIGEACGLSVLGDDASGKTAASILATMTTAIRALGACEDGDFSVRDWITNGKGNLYLSTAGKNDTVFLPIVSLFLDLIGREIKEQPDSGAGGVRLLILIDELAAYPAMQTLHFLVAEARSKGVSVIVATQTLQKVFKIYGEKDGKDIFGNSKTKIIFKTIEPQDAQYLENAIGKAEVQREIRARNENSSIMLGRIDGREGETRTNQIVEDKIFLASELQELPTGRAVVIHPDAGEAVAALQFEPYKGKKIGVEFQPIQRETISAREFAAEKAKRDAAEKAAAEKAEEEKAAEFFRNFKPEPAPAQQSAGNCQPSASSTKVDEKEAPEPKPAPARDDWGIE